MNKAKLEDTLNLLGKRIIPCHIYSLNKQGMQKWQFNCCLQTHMTVAWYLSTQQPGEPDLQGDIRVFEADFKAPKHLEISSYNHSWVFVEGPDLFVDVARVSYNTVIRFNAMNSPEAYLPVEEIEGSRREHDWRNAGLQKEYLTGKMGLELVAEIVNLLSLYHKVPGTTRS